MNDVQAMELAIEEARLALSHDDVPIGAVVLLDGEVIARRHNERELTQDPTAHAEILVLRDASGVVGSWRLTSASLVVTLEPCAMCAGACVASRIGRLVYGASDPKAGSVRSLYNICADPRLNHEPEISTGMLGGECAELLTTFFSHRRIEAGQ